MWQFSIFIGSRCKQKTTDIWRCANEELCVPDKTGWQQHEAFGLQGRVVEIAHVGQAHPCYTSRTAEYPPSAQEHTRTLLGPMKDTLVVSKATIVSGVERQIMKRQCVDIKSPSAVLTVITMARNKLFKYGRTQKLWDSYRKMRNLTTQAKTASMRKYFDDKCHTRLANGTHKQILGHN